jgi:hypothetical protein
MATKFVSRQYGIKAEALAYSYLKIRKELTNGSYASRNHTVLAPCAINVADLGRSAGAGPYWDTFFTKVKQGFATGHYYPGSEAQTGLSNIADFKVLHAHFYEAELRNWPLSPSLTSDIPIISVAKLAVAVRRAADWLREVYGIPITSDIPINIFLSECGPYWKFESPGQTNPDRYPYWWAGGWPDFQMGLSWWNTWLCWLTRVAASQCKLQGAATGAHALHTGIHNCTEPPYATRETVSKWGNSYWSLGNFRNQVYFNCDNAVWTTGFVYNAESVNVPALATPGRFQRSFSSFFETPWDYPAGLPYKFWRNGPFAVCYKVWSEIGNDPDPAVFGSGWYANTSSGAVGTYSIAIPAGYSTIYFPLVKNALGANIYSASTQISFAWLKQDANGNTIGTNYHGYMQTSEFSDSQTFTDFNPWGVSPSPHYNQNIYSAMVFPCVCYSSTAKIIKIRLERNVSGPELKFGRPIVLPYVCSWFYSQ